METPNNAKRNYQTAFVPRSMHDMWTSQFETAVEKETEHLAMVEPNTTKSMNCLSLLDISKTLKAKLLVNLKDENDPKVEVVLSAVRAFNVELNQLHNDSTTVTFTGNYPTATGTARAGVTTAKITHGHNKDHRPDLKQLVCVLTVSADGAVPIAFRVEDGNTNDDGTHIPTWDELATLVGRPDFLYVADAKLANRAAMDHINNRGGRFVTVLPRSRREDRAFRDWIFDHTPDWTEALRRPARTRGVRVVSVADLKGAPRLLRGVIRGGFPKDTVRSILMDFSGQLGRALRGKRSSLVAVVYGADGRLRRAVELPTGGTDATLAELLLTSAR
jgi:hypothetical protein